MNGRLPITINRDRSSPASHRILPVVLILDNLRSAFNIGNIFRIAETLRVQHIIGCGYSALPPHPKLEKTARGCDQLVPFSHYAEAVQAVRELKEQGYHLAAVETVADSVSIWEWQATFPLALILGNEAKGISSPALNACHSFLSLPRFGCKNSLNVGNCAAVVTYEARRQWEAF